MTRLTPEQREREASGIRTFAAWPRWPILPIKRPSDEPGKWPEISVIVCHALTKSEDVDDWDFGLHPEGGDRVRIYPAHDMFNIEGADLNEIEYRDFDTVDALLDAGWIVD